MGLADAFGIQPCGWVAEIQRSLASVLTEALAAGEPRLVVIELVLTPPRTTSPRWNDPV